MNIVDKIYENRIAEEQSLSEEHKLSSEIYQILSRENYDEDEKMAELLFEAAGRGQQAGFRLGFYTAVALLVECLG